MCGPIIMSYMLKDKIIIIYPTTNASGHVAATKRHFLGHETILGLNLQDPSVPTFEINGHGASVWVHYKALHMKRQNLHNLPHYKCIWSHCRNKTSLFRTLRLYWD